MTYPTNHLVLLGLTVGDALAAATEFESEDAIRARYGDTFREYQPGSPFGFKPGEATDDTQMTLALLHGLRAPHDGSDRARAENVAREFRGWMEAAPPDVGAQTARSIRRGRLSGGFEVWAESRFDAAGNGGLMRAAGVYVSGARGEDALHLAALTCALTHADPRSVYTSVALVAALERLHAGEPYGEAWLNAVLDCYAARAGVLIALRSLVGTPSGETYHWLESFEALTDGALKLVRHAVNRGLRGEGGSQSGYTIDTLQAAVACGGAPSFIEGAELCALRGNDSDTAGAVTGAVLGARGLVPPENLLAPLRVGHSWSRWNRKQSALRAYAELMEATPA